ncbi:uncharacterized protein BKA78DRAFT_3347 [Phyllosticta capitalensis]|uniref:uncharacterized protein n=1 Tax=Phyllosticta capitalensis TaxID=121624 RepID=UPI0031308D39
MYLPAELSPADLFLTQPPPTLPHCNPEIQQRHSPTPRPDRGAQQKGFQQRVPNDSCEEQSQILGCAKLSSIPPPTTISSCQEAKFQQISAMRAERLVRGAVTDSRMSKTILPSTTTSSRQEAMGLVQQDVQRRRHVPNAISRSCQSCRPTLSCAPFHSHALSWVTSHV